MGWTSTTSPVKRVEARYRAPATLVEADLYAIADAGSIPAVSTLKGRCAGPRFGPCAAAFAVLGGEAPRTRNPQRASVRLTHRADHQTACGRLESSGGGDEHDPRPRARRPERSCPRQDQGVPRRGCRSVRHRCRSAGLAQNARFRMRAAHETFTAACELKRCRPWWTELVAARPRGAASIACSVSYKLPARIWAPIASRK